MDEASADRIDDKLHRPWRPNFSRILLRWVSTVWGLMLARRRDFFIGFPFGRKFEVFALAHGEKFVGIDGTFLVKNSDISRPKPMQCVVLPMFQ
jgi:hypothetical protein